MDNKSLIQILLGEFYDKLASLNGIVMRDASFVEASNKIKVAIGMRRTGKTYFVYQHILKLLKGGIQRSCILYINFEDDRLSPINSQKLAKLVDAFYSLFPENHEQKCYFFFDEIQNVEDWPQLIRRLHDSKNVEIFLTGSSAKLLSKEIATSLRGRSLSCEIWPYSFSEYMRAKKIEIDVHLYDTKTKDKLGQQFHHYLAQGGFPEVIPYTADVRKQTLQEYLDVTIYRDIIERHKVKNPSLIKYMILSMIHNTARPFAVNKFYNDVKSQGYQVGKDILYEYVAHIEDAYLAFLVPLYDKSIRKVQTNPKKLYAIDPGMVRAVTLDYEHDLGKLFENIIFLDLKRLGCTVHYYLTRERYEIDFLIITPRGDKKLLQVCWNMDDEQTTVREKRALHAAMEELNLPGAIVTLDSYLSEGAESLIELSR